MLTAENGFMISFRLLDFEQPTIVQHFGACIFYDTIRERWEECLSNEDLVCKHFIFHIFSVQFLELLYELWNECDSLSSEHSKNLNEFEEAYQFIISTV